MQEKREANLEGEPSCIVQDCWWGKTFYDPKLQELTLMCKRGLNIVTLIITGFTYINAYGYGNFNSYGHMVISQCIWSSMFMLLCASKFCWHFLKLMLLCEDQLVCICWRPIGDLSILMIMIWIQMVMNVFALVCIKIFLAFLKVYALVWRPIDVHSKWLNN